MRILLIEDSPRLRKTLGESLSRMGHAVDTAADGNEGESMVRIHDYDAVILDRMLPGKDGLHILKDIRRDGIQTPVLLLTALDGVDETVTGLTAGADDYLTKPFALSELAARIEAIGRRFHGRADSEVRIGPLEVNLASKSVRVHGAPVSLTAREFSELECLARKPGEVLSRARIEASIYAETDSPLSNAVDAAIYSLRRKLFPDGDAASLIQTRRGLGYILEVP